MSFKFIFSIKIKYYEDSEKAIKQPNKTETLNPFMRIVQQKQQENQQQHHFQQQGLANFTIRQSPPSPALQSPIQNISSVQQPNFSFQQSSPTHQNQTIQMNLNSSFPNNNAPVNLFNQLINKPHQQNEPNNSLLHGLSTQTNFFQQNVPINNQLNMNSNTSHSNVFGNSPFSGFGNSAQAHTQPVNIETLNYYSNTNELSEQDLKEFSSSQFTMGKIPRNPPPQHLV